MDSLDSQPKTFIVSTGTTNSTDIAEASGVCDGLQADSNNVTAVAADNTITTSLQRPQQCQSNSADLLNDQQAAETLIKRSGSMNEEYITLNIDNTDDPLQPESPEEIKQNLKNVENVCNLEPIYECPASPGDELGKEMMRRSEISVVWQLSLVKFTSLTPLE